MVSFIDHNGIHSKVLIYFATLNQVFNLDFIFILVKLKLTKTVFMFYFINLNVK